MTFPPSDLIAGYRAKQFSPSEVLEEVIEHVAAWEPHIKALYLFDPDSARAAAQASTDRWQKGEPVGTLDGVPVTIKDNIATKGQPIPLGAASVKLVPAEKDAPPAARLREAGAIIFSKTTMPDYGMLSSGLSSFHPLTRNPWDLTRIPAAPPPALAPRARPATARCISAPTSAVRYGCRPLVRPGRAEAESRARSDRSALCRPRRRPMTRTVDDAALMMCVLSKPDRRDGMSLPADTHSLEGLDKSPRKLRIGLMLDAGTGQPLVRRGARGRRQGGQGVRSAGAVVTEIDGILTREMLDGLDTFLARADVGRSLTAVARGARQDAAYIHKWAEAARRLSGVDVVGASTHDGDPRRRGNPVPRPRLRDFAGLAGRELPGEFASPATIRTGRSSTSAFTVPWNMAENPAVSINGGYDDKGFPIGVQIVGRRFDDLGVLGMAKASRACAARNGPGRPRRR